MDRSQLRKRVLKDLIGSPWVLLPVAGGLTALLAGWAIDGGGPLFAFAGIMGLLAGAGMFATRWLFQGDKLIRRAFGRIEADAAALREQKLDDLQQQLETDDDPRTGQALSTLRQLQEQLRQLLKEAAGRSAIPPVEIVSMIERLVGSCITSLERSLRLWEAAQRMMTPEAARDTLDRREQVLAEVDQSIAQMAKTLDGMRQMSIDAPDVKRLAAIRRELDQSLEVARRVEQRMQSLESEFSNDRANVPDHERL